MGSTMCKSQQVAMGIRIHCLKENLKVCCNSVHTVTRTYGLQVVLR